MTSQGFQPLVTLFDVSYVQVFTVSEATHRFPALLGTGPGFQEAQFTITPPPSVLRNFTVRPKLGCCLTYPVVYNENLDIRDIK